MSNPPPASTVTRREFTRWILSLSALLCSSSSDALSSANAIFLRPGDRRSDPALLRRRLRSGSSLPNDLAGNALRWRLLADEAAASSALQTLRQLNPGKASSRTWPAYAQLSMAADWLTTWKAFTSADRASTADLLLHATEEILAAPEMRIPAQTSYQNYPVRYLGLAVFTLTAAGRLAPAHPQLAELRARTAIALRNVLQLTQFVTPDGSFHESMDYMRITLLPLVMLAELQRTLTGIDPADRFTLFRSIGPTYIYKLLPDRTPSREGDNEYPLLDDRDAAALAYALHRFDDPHAAWLLKHADITLTKWNIPILQFLWANPLLHPLDPAASSPRQLSRSRHFRGVDQVVFRSGFSPGGTRIEFDCGPYFAKHQHLDRGHFTIQHRGHLAIDSGADYTDAESPHYLNYYRRSVAHNTLLVFDPAERFFWSEDVIAAANDGGQRMDSSRFWNTIRSIDDWNNTRDLWDLAHIEAVDTTEPRYCYTKGDAARAYSSTKLSRFTRELLYLPVEDLLIVFDDVRSTRADLRKTWLLHAVDEPSFLPAGSSTPAAHGASLAPAETTSIRIAHHEGELTLYPILPAQRTLLKRGGPGFEFWTPGNANGGDWGSGRNWPLDPPAGGPLPADPEERRLWKIFYGEDFNRILPSNSRNVVPGSWRIELSPSTPATQDLFLNVFEIGARNTTGNLHVERIHSTSVEGVACNNLLILFRTAAPGESIEFTLPSMPAHWLFLRGLAPSTRYRADLTGGNLGDNPIPPGAPIQSLILQSNHHGIATLTAALQPGSRLRLHAI